METKAGKIGITKAKERREKERRRKEMRREGRKKREDLS